MSDWQPIETAPIEEGFSALLFVPGINDWRRPRKLPYMMVGVWEGNCWVSDYAEIEGYESTGDYIVHPPLSPTHWQPLPAPPTLPKSSE